MTVDVGVGVVSIVSSSCGMWCVGVGVGGSISASYVGAGGAFSGSCVGASESGAFSASCVGAGGGEVLRLW